MERCKDSCHHCKNKMSSTSVTQGGTNVIIAVTIDGALNMETRYCLILAQPVPVAGYNLPINLVVTSADSGDVVTVALKRLLTPFGGVCNLEFGEDLPKCRSRIPLYYTNGNDFVDLRKCGYEVYHKTCCR